MIFEESSYDRWMRDNVTETYGTCAEVTSAMSEAFPDLVRVRGHYYCHVWGERAHWWLIDKDGNIIDPTREQFPSKGKGKYVPWDESQAEPTGKCINCGGFTYGGESVCSDQCSQEAAAVLLHPPMGTVVERILRDDM